jgi:hypothetical protein
MARHRDDAWTDPVQPPVAREGHPDELSGEAGLARLTARNPVMDTADPADPADPALLRPDSRTARLTGGSAGPAFGYPAFTAAPRGDFEFHSQSWHLGADGFEQIGDADVIRRGLGRRREESSDWDPLTDPWPSAADPSVATAQTDSEAFDSAAEHTQPIALWGTLAVPLELTQPVDLAVLFGGDDDPDEHPSGPLPQAGVWPPAAAVPDSPAGWLSEDVNASYDATLSGPLGSRELGFRGGQWYSLLAASARPVSAAEALRTHPQLAGQITQLVCWWIRRNPMSDRALDLACELATGVAGLARGDARQRA